MPAQQELFMRVATEEFCGCTSALTLAGCLEMRPGCQTAGHLRHLLVRGINAGASQTQLEGFLSQDVLGPFCAPPMSFQTDGAPQKGPARAPITIVEFADFRCSHCRHAVPLVHQALQAYANQAQLFYLPLALQDNEFSLAAAEASLAAHAQRKFWEMHAALFAREEGDFTPDVIRSAAKKVGLNLKQFDKDVASHRFRDQLNVWKELSREAHVEGTPAFFINGRRFNPTPDVFTLEDRLAMEIDRDQGNCK